MGGGKWDSDGVRGGPSSLDVLLEWLAVRGNADAWLKSEGNEGGARSELISEIHDLLLGHGLSHRDRASIVSKLWGLKRQLDKADNWLKCKGLRWFDVGKETERAVLQICPRYRELAPLLRSVDASSGNKRNMNYESSEEESGDEDGLGNRQTQRRINDHSSQPLAKKSADFSSAKWDSDGVNGRPSSLDVILEWILTPGNAERWQEAARRADGSRRDLACEVYDLLLIHGITHRTRRGVESKFYTLEAQFDKAENWLKSRGIHHYTATTDAERTVLRLCPTYPKIESVLRSALRSAAVTRSQANGGKAMGAAFKQVGYDPVVAQASSPKRLRTGQCWKPPKRVHTDDTEGVAILEPEPGERREFFKLELQVKRDQAIFVRAKTRKALLDMGVSRGDVDRLLPL